MPTQRLATQLVIGNPTRIQQWNASIRAGDDLKLALTVFADDMGTLADVRGARGLLTLAGDACHSGARFGCAGDCDTWGWDYGAGSFTQSGALAVQAVGFAVPRQPGRMNFAVPSSITAGLSGRYRFLLRLDTMDGETCQVEGILQARASWTDGGQLHRPTTFFRLDHSPLDGTDPLAAQLSDSTQTYFQLDRSQLDRNPLDGDAEPLGPGGTNGLPVDPDGFFLLTATWQPPTPPPAPVITFEPELGDMVLGGFVLGDFIP